MAENTTDSAADLIALAGDITIAWLQNPNVHPGAQDVPAFLTSMHEAITRLGSEAAPEPETAIYEPAVSVRSSVKPDHLVSLIDGKKYKTLKRHLSTNGLTPDEYRARYGLKADYPMVAESYATQRREIAQKLGLGRKSAVAQPVATEALSEAPVAAPAKAKRTTGKAKAEAVAEAVTPTPVKSKAVKSKTAAVSEPEAAPVSAEPKRAARKAKAQAAPEAVTPPEVAEKKPAAAKSKRTARPLAVDAPAEADAAVIVTPESEALAKPKRAPAKPKATAAKKAVSPAKAPRAKKAKVAVPAEAPVETSPVEPSAV